MAMASLPMLLAVGMAVDYSNGTAMRSDMQNALDAAVLSAMALPGTASNSDREAELDKAYAANGGSGEATLGDVDTSGETLSVAAGAQYAMPTNFMGIVNKSTMDIAVGSKAAKQRELTEAKFKLSEVTGWWDKKVTLFAKMPEPQPPKALMEIDYKYNGLGGVGVGTTTVRKLQGDKMVDVFKQDCSAVLILTSCKNSTLSGDGTASVNIADHDNIYLQMDISATGASAKNMLKSAKVPTTIRTDDGSLADRLFVDGEQQKKGQPVPIASKIECAKWSKQAWEDGGGIVKGQKPVEGTDFKYEVEGKCGWGDGTKGVALVR